jgi:hypothetical protein
MRPAQARRATTVVDVERDTASRQGDGCHGPDPAGQARSPRGAVGAVVHLQRSAGNAAVARLLQRADAEAPAGPAELIAKYTSMFMLDEAALGKDLAARVVAKRDVGLAHAVFDALRTTDRDDVAEELARAAGNGLRQVDEGLRIRLIREMLDAVVDEDAERQVNAVWQSFEAEGTLATVIANQRALWTRSLEESQPLRDRYAAYRAAFRTDVMRAAQVYLDENRKLTQQKAKEVGIDLGGEGAVAPPELAAAHLDEVRKAAVVVSQLEGLLAELRRIPVGYRNTDELQRKLVDNASTDAQAFVSVTNPSPDKLRRHGEPELFDPNARPGFPPTGQDTPEMTPWGDVHEHYSKIESVIATYARTYPAIHASITQGAGAKALADTADSAQARAVVERTLKKTLASITDVKGQLGSGITYHDLVPIQEQLFTNSLAPPAKASLDWQNPLYATLARFDLEEKKAKDFWTQLGLDMLAAFALIAAPFTGGLSAAVLTTIGVGIGVAGAAASWNNYLNLRPLESAAIRDDMSFVQKGAVDAALLEALVATAMAFLDARGASSALKEGAAVNRAKALADLHGTLEAQEAAAQARMKMQSGALKEAGATAAGAAVAVGAHELEEPLPEPDIMVTGGGIAFDADPVAPVAQKSVQRLPSKKSQLASTQAAMAAIDAGDIPLHWGDRFELSVLSSVLRGEVAEMAGVTYAFRAQFGESGHGIDIIAIGTDGKGKLKIWQIECKWVTPGSRFSQKLGGSAHGIQTSAGWTKANFLEWWKGASARDKRNLLDAVKVANGGVAVSEARLVKLITDAEVIIAGPLGAGVAGLMRKVWGKMGALVKLGGRKPRYVEFRPH